jgi:hypothetical protein
MIMMRVWLTGVLLLAAGAGAAETPRTLLVELRQVPEDMRASSGVEAGPGHYSYDSYDRDRILSVVRDVVLMLATPGELAQARAEGLEARVLMESTDQLTLIRRALYGPTFKLAPVYHSYDQITARAQALARTHPGLITQVQIGETTQFKRPIYAYRLSNDARRAQERPAVLLDGCHHSDEILGAEIVLAFMEKHLAGYGRDTAVTAWMDTLEIWLVPVINVDGHDMVTSGREPRWRKNLRDVNGDGIVGVYPEGVDVNRGYDYNWAQGGTGDPAKVSYRGLHPFSEAENRAMRHLAGLRQFLLSVSYHSQGEVIFYPWTWAGKPAPDDDIIKRIASEVAANIPKMEGKGAYTISPGGASSQSYPWFYGRHGTIDLIIETGKGAHIFPPEEVPGIVAANLQGVSALLSHANGPGLAVKVTDAATGAPLVAQVWLPQIENETVDRRTTDAEFGRRWRLLAPGSHYVIISCPGYRTVVLPAAAVGATGWTELHVKLEADGAIR